jgi:uncharacterized protein YjbI with pentapeptide repeats
VPHWPDWTGFSAKSWEKRADREVRPSKTLWDWLDLIAVPLMLALIAVSFNLWETSRQTNRDEATTRRERQIARESRLDTLLQTYIKQLTDLVLDDRLLDSKKGSDVRGVARTLTLAAIRRLDGNRKGEVIRYLADSQLITGRAERDDESNPSTQPPPRISLDGADLHDADLREAVLVGVSFANADLRRARFDRTELTAVDFNHVRLQKASFAGADLGEVDFHKARLDGASFDRAQFGTFIAPVKIGSGDANPAYYNRFDFACVSKTTFHQAVLDGLSLHKAIGKEVDLTGSKVDTEAFRGAQLRDVQVTPALVHGDLPAEWPATTDTSTIDYRLPYFCSADGQPAK